MSWNAPWMQNQPSNRLGAVIGPGERTEYRLSNRLFKVLGMEDSGAFCAPDIADIEQLVQMSNIVYDPAEPGYDPAIIREVASLMRELRDDFGKLLMRKGGAPARVPACVTRKDAPPEFHDPELDKYARRSAAIHERLHASIRASEVRSDIPEYDKCETKKIAKLLFDLDSKKYGQLFTVGSVLDWAPVQDVIPEEILARMEEVRVACLTDKSKRLRNPRECAAANATWAQQFDMVNAQLKKVLGSSALQIDPTILWELGNAVTKKYGSPFGLAQNAIASCAGSKFKPGRRGMKRKGQKARAKARKAAASKPKTFVEFE